MPTPTPILADVGKLFACGAGLGAGTAVGALGGIELAAADNEDAAVNVELARSEEEAGDVETDAESTLSTR